MDALVNESLGHILELAEERRRRDRHRTMQFYTPYRWQSAFHSASAENSQCLLIAGNRVGKTFCGSFEAAYHLTGVYPEWWRGRRFTRPVRMWAAGTTNEKTRDILQAALLGDPKDVSAFGTAAVPLENIVQTTRKPGIPNALSAVAIRHASGDNSVLAFKAYEMGQEAFMGESLDVIWLDEAPPEEIYSQCLVRVLDRKGYVYMTFTAERGAAKLAYRFLNSPEKGQCIINATWNDAPHLDETTRAQILQAIPESERTMRMTGLPSLGSGNVFPIPESQLRCKPFELPSYMPRIGGMDFGYDHPTAVVELAWDRDTDTIYLVSCYRERSKVIGHFAKEIREKFGKLRIAWPHDGMRHDPGSGEGLADQYRRLGLMMLPHHFTNPPTAGQNPDQGGNAVEPGIQAMLQYMSAGRFKVFDIPENEVWFQEYRMYHREDGLIVKYMDDLMSATRYAFQSRRFARNEDPVSRPTHYETEENPLALA